MAEAHHTLLADTDGPLVHDRDLPIPSPKTMTEQLLQDGNNLELLFVKKHMFLNNKIVFMFTLKLRILMIFKLEKNAKKTENTWKIKKQNFKTEKNRKQNKWGKKGTSKRGKNGKMDLSICIVFAFIVLFRFAFLLLFCFFLAFAW